MPKKVLSACLLFVKSQGKAVGTRKEHSKSYQKAHLIISIHLLWGAVQGRARRRRSPKYS